MRPGARQPRTLVIGGSLGGLFAANLLARQGWDVEVFEHSGEDLVGRGAGIITHPELFAALERIGIPLDDSFGVDIPRRITFDRQGRVIGTLPLRQNLTTWGRLYQLLKGAFPAERYHFGHTFRELRQDASGVSARFANGAEARGDLLIAADGIRSSVRAQLASDAKPVYAGYVAWRGLADERSFTPAEHRDLFPNFAFCLPAREQMLGYPVAGFASSTRPGKRCYNFVWYRPVAEEGAFPQLCTDTNGRQHDMSVPPPLIRPEVITNVRQAADDLLSPQFAAVVRNTRQPFFQAIFDLESQEMVFGRVALLGDAAFVARPHCGMGVTKAAGDAMRLADLLRSSGDDVAAALPVYAAERTRFGVSVVRHARELGAFLQGFDTEAARGHHTPEAVMREIAVTRDFP